MRSINNLNLRNKQYIIFDLDGTLVDSIGVWNKIDQKIIKEYSGVTVDLDSINMDRETFLHKNQDKDIYVAYCEYLIKKYDFKIQDAEELLKIRWNGSGKILENETDFKQNVPELLFKLKELGFTIILATMSTQFQLDIYSKKNQKMIKQLNIEEEFDLITKKEDVKRKKPDPEIYYKIMQYYNASPDECLIFEDSYTGVLAGKKAGIEVVNVYDEYADLDREKINLIADYYIRSFNQFIELLDKNIKRTTLVKKTINKH